MKKIVRAVTLLCLVSLTGSCVTYRVSVDSLAAPNSPGNSVFVAPGDPNIDPGDLLFQEFAAQVEIALKNQGFLVVDDFAEADQVVFLTYGISDPQEQTIAIPQYGRTGINSATTQGTIYSYGSTSTFTGTTTYNYEYGITGYQNVTRTVYTRIIILDSYDIRAFATTNRMIQVWKTDIISTGRSSDLRQTFPYMMAAADDYLGRDSNRQVTVNLSARSSAVIEYQDP